MNYSKTLKCSSIEGELLGISVSDFNQHVKKQGESWDLLCNYSLRKSLKLRHHIGISREMRVRKIINDDNQTIQRP